MVAHASLTGADLHESKGVASASTGTVYVANGAGSGVWKKLGTAELDTSAIFNLNRYAFALHLTDVSTASFVLSPLPFAATLNRVTTVLHGAITTADATLTVINSTGPATIGTITIATAGSGEGTIDTLNASVNNSFTAGSFIKISTDGNSDTAAGLTILLEFTRTA